MIQNQPKMLPSLYAIKEAPLAIRIIESKENNYLHPIPKADKHFYFEALWIVKGKGNCLIDLEEFEINDNMFFCLRPDQVYRLQANGCFFGYSISFTESFFCIGEREDASAYQSSIIQSITRSPCIVSIAAAHDMNEIMKKMIDELDNDHLFRIEMLRRYLKIFFVYVARQFEDSLHNIVQTRDIELVQKFKTYVDKNFITTKLVSDYAAMLFVTPNYLNTVVKKITGYSARCHIRHRTVLEAKRKATYAGLGMKEIAYYLGFVDISHFSKYFKKATGTNFSAFKKESYLLQVAD
ncbi:MAG: helix-turn-helix domain-containing protein [Ferruginibacter sp.]